MFYTRMVMEVAAGLLVFIIGLFTLRSGMGELSNRESERLIERLVKTPFRGLLTGIVATAMLQSGAAVTILSMGLVAAGTLRFADTIGIILGSNIGSTLTVGLLSLNLDAFGPYLVAAGSIAFLASFFAPRKRPPSVSIKATAQRRIRAWGLSVIGFGTLFVGFGLMTHATMPLASSPWVTHLLLQAGRHPMLGIAAGTVVTAMIGSSSASTALTMSLAKAGALPLLAGIAIVFGNNIGTCATALLAAIGGTRDVLRVAAFHVLLNVLGTCIFFLALLPFAKLVQSVTKDPVTQIVVAHVLFNVISSLAALPFSRLFARLLTAVIPDRRRSA